jgi:hypothetical protein
VGVRHKVVELPLVPGALSDDTDLAAKLHAISMDKVRSRGNRWETIKGWSAFNASGLTAGTARGIHSYADLDGDPIVVAASESALNAWKGGTRYNITPKWADVWLDEDAITTNSGTATVTWLVYDPSTDTSVEAPHFLQVGDSITISGHVNATTTTGAVVNGTFTVATVVSPTKFTFTTTGTGSDSQVAFTVTVAFRNGLATGTGDTAATRARVWSIDNFGENAVFCGSDGTPVFYWQPETDSTEILTNGTFTGALTGWSAGTGWTSSSNAARHSGTGEGDLKQDISATVEGGKTYELSFAVTAYTTNTLTFRVRMDAVDIFDPNLGGLSGATTANAVQTYTFRFVAPADPAFLIFTADGSAAGATIDIDTVSLKRLTIAHPILTAPSKNYALFVDGNRILTTLGSVESDGDFNPTLVRWSDQDNYREWVSDTDNVAGEFPLGSGSYAVCGAPVGGSNLILTDTGAFTANFTGTSAGYSFRPLGKGCGAVGQRGLAVYGNRAFWPSRNALYAYDGAQVLPIECPIKDQYVGMLKQYQENKTFAWMNHEYGEVWVHYPHTSDGNEVSRYLIFNAVEQGNPWSFGTWDRTCMTPAGVYANPIGIDASDNIWKHETGTSFSGTGIVVPFIKTGFVTGEAGDRWLGVRRYYPDIENQVGNILFTVTGKRLPQGQNNTQVIGPLVLIPNEDKVDFLLAARQFQFEWRSSSTTTSWRLGVVPLEMRAEKERR